ncbi:MAG: PorV/PorQ family protein [Candidatus Firestonebacteria bacterium]
MVSVPIYAASFLKIGVGARPVSLGESYVGLSDDINSINWNPAGLGSLEFPEITASHLVWLIDTSEEHFAFALPVKDIGTLGVNFIYLNGGSLNAYNVLGENTGSFNACDLNIGLSYSNYFKISNKRLYYGLNVKYIVNFIELEKSSSFAIDLGLLAKDIFENFSLGLSAFNLGTSVNFGRTDESLPFNLKAGIYWKVVPEFNLVSDLTIPNDNNVKIGIGVESWVVKNYFALRAGWTTRIGIAEYDGLSGFTAGVGFNISGFSLDYAYVPYGNLGYTHRVSLGYSFGQKVNQVVQSSEIVNSSAGSLNHTGIIKTEAVEKKIAVAVIDLVANDVSKSQTSIISDLLRTSLSNSKDLLVLERANMHEILKEQAFQKTGCTEVECAVEIGKLLNVEKMIVGSVSKLADKFYINIRVVDVETGVSLFGETEEVLSESKLYSATMNLSLKIKKRL